MKSSFKIVRREAVDIAGRSHDAVVVEATVNTSGDVRASSTQTLWISESLALILRVDQKGTGPTGTSDVSAKLQSTKPS